LFNFNGVPWYEVVLPNARPHVGPPRPSVSREEEKVAGPFSKVLARGKGSCHLFFPAQGRHPPADEESQARWCRRAVEGTSALANGWLNWGLYDHPEALDVTQLTGLLTVQGRPKAWAHAFRDMSRTLSVRATLPAAPRSRPSLDWDRCLTDTRAGRQFREEYLRAFPK
jgi:hypothetical protein